MSKKKKLSDVSVLQQASSESKNVSTSPNTDTTDYSGLLDPIYGIRHENITSRITRHNWKKKAIVRCCKGGWLYLWISRESDEDCDSEGKCELYDFYGVNAAGSGEQSIHSTDCRDGFIKLMDAIRYINGEDNEVLGGVLAQKTWLPKSSEEYPQEGEFPENYDVFYNEHWFDPKSEAGRKHYREIEDAENKFYAALGGCGVSLPARIAAVAVREAKKQQQRESDPDEQDLEIPKDPEPSN